MRRAVLAWGIGMLARLWCATLRCRRVGPAFEPGLIAFWHGDQLPLLPMRPEGDVVAPVSLSRDGRLQARILARFDIDEIGGSSSRGGSGAARGLLRALRRGAFALMAVDGPRGPRHVVKPGVVFLAQRAARPIWPVAVAVRRGRRSSRAWDRFLLPLPFTRVVMVVGAPIRPDPSADVAQACADLADTLGRLSLEAQALVRP